MLFKNIIIMNLIYICVFHQENYINLLKILMTSLITRGNINPNIANDILDEEQQEEIHDYLTTRVLRNPEIPLFHTDDRLGFTPNSLCQWFFWTYKRAGINGASSHSGRKTFLTSLANKGISIHILASLAGHKSIAVTHRYLIANDDMKRNAVELI
jgi:integrase/recombinase XerD